MNYCGLIKHDIADGPGVRVGLFVSGCRHHCKGCFQPETWDFQYGQPFDRDAMIAVLAALNHDWISGITILGGVSSGLNKTRAARLSFLMSAPAILGSLLMEGRDAIKEGYFKNMELFPSLIGVAVAAVTGFFAIRFMMKIIGKISLCWFSLYVAVIGIVVLLLQLAGSPRLPAFEIPSSAAEQKQAVQVQDQQADTESGQTESQPEDVVVLSTPQQMNQPEDIAPQDTAPQPIPIPEPEPQDFG